MENKSFKIIEIEDIGYHNTSDLELEEQHHFYANDIVVSNSHAISYSQLAYWTAYMKAKHPEKFTEVMFNHHVGDLDNLAITLTMARKLLDNPKVSLGDINSFSTDYRVSGNNIIIGLKSVKGIGDALVKKIVNNSPAGGWLTFQEFMADNIYKKMIPYRDVQLLAQLGMFEDFPLNGGGKTASRKGVVGITEVIFRLSDAKKKDYKNFVNKVIGGEDVKLESLLNKANLEKIIEFFDINIEEEYTEREIIEFEVENVGFRISEDDNKRQTIINAVESMNIHHISEFDEDNQGNNHFWAVISSVEKLKTKKGKPYANVRLDDSTSFRVWHNKLVYIEDELLPGRVIMIKLTADTFGRSLSWDKHSFMCEDEIVKLYQEVNR